MNCNRYNKEFTALFCVSINSRLYVSDIMKPITVWQTFRYGKWQHNHIEDGHSERIIPKPQSNQQQVWDNQEWIKEHKHMNRNNEVV